MSGEMYPVRLYSYIFPDTLLHISAGSWSGHRHVFGCVRFFELFSNNYFHSTPLSSMYLGFLRIPDQKQQFCVFIAYNFIKRHFLNKFVLFILLFFISSFCCENPEIKCSKCIFSMRKQKKY